MPKMKRNRYKELTFHFLKNFSADIYKETLERISFPNYKEFDNLNIAYSDFSTRLDYVINTIALFDSFVIIENNASSCFDKEISKKIHTRGKL